MNKINSISSNDIVLSHNDIDKIIEIMINDMMNRNIFYNQYNDETVKMHFEGAIESIMRLFLQEHWKQCFNSWFDRRRNLVPFVRDYLKSNWFKKFLIGVSKDKSTTIVITNETVNDFEEELSCLNNKVSRITALQYRERIKMYMQNNPNWDFFYHDKYLEDFANLDFFVQNWNTSIEIPENVRLYHVNIFLAQKGDFIVNWSVGSANFYLPDWTVWENEYVVMPIFRDTIPDGFSQELLEKIQKKYIEDHLVSKSESLLLYNWINCKKIFI
jgi:hypothetical protein